MRPLIIQDVHELGEFPFLVTIIYGPDGQKIDERVLEYDEDALAAILSAIEMKDVHGLERVPEYWSSTRELIATAISTVGVAPTYKRREETQITYRAVSENAEVLRELYNIEPKGESQEEPLSKCRQIIINLCQGAIGALNQIITKLGG